MRKSILFLLMTSGLCSAQTTITKAFHDPIIGDVVNNNNTVNGTVNNSATGSNVTFSNGALTPGGASVTTYIAPTSSEITTFPGSTIKMVNAGNTVLYKSSATKVEITGLITPDATLNLSVNNGTLITYPASFGYTEIDMAQGTFTSSSASGLCRGTINISADASGTLILGSSTFPNVLRIKSIQNFNLYLPNDTTFSFPIGTVTNAAYSYYDNTHKAPLLGTTQAVINVPLAGINNQTTNGAQALSQLFLGINDNLAKKNNFKVYPNPAQDIIELMGGEKNYSSINIYSLDGKLIKTSEAKSGKIQISELPPAAYFIEVTHKNTKETVKFIKK